MASVLPDFWKYLFYLFHFQTLWPISQHWNYPQWSITQWETDLDKDGECSRSLVFDTVFHNPHFPQIIICFPALAPSRALSLASLPLLIYSPPCVFSISSFTLHKAVHPSIHAAQPHSSSLPSSSSLKCFHIRFFRNLGVLFWLITQTLAHASKFKSLSLALPLPFPSSHPLHAPSMHAVRSCFIMPKHRGWNLINGAHI